MISFFTFLNSAKCKSYEEENEKNAKDCVVTT